MTTFAYRSTWYFTPRPIAARSEKYFARRSTNSVSSSLAEETLLLGELPRIRALTYPNKGFLKISSFMHPSKKSTLIWKAMAYCNKLLKNHVLDISRP